MVEFSDREKALIHTMSFMLNPTTKQVPIGLRATALRTMLGIRGINISEDECKDMTFGIEAEQSLAIQEGFAFLDNHKDAFKGIGDLAKFFGEKK